MSLALPVLVHFQAETPVVMLRAAEARLMEAEALLTVQQWDGSVYLAGYIAEMLLKIAYCRLDPAFPANGTVDTVFGPAAALWKSLVPGVALPFQHKHNLLFWETVLDARRQMSGVAPAEWGLRLSVSKHLLTIRLNWRVDLRYQSPLVTDGEAQDVCTAARWLFDNQSTLWS